MATTGCYIALPGITWGCMPLENTFSVPVMVFVERVTREADCYCTDHLGNVVRPDSLVYHGHAVLASVVFYHLLAECTSLAQKITNYTIAMSRPCMHTHNAALFRGMPFTFPFFFVFLFLYKSQKSSITIIQYTCTITTCGDNMELEKS